MTSSPIASDHPLTRRLGGNHAMRVEDKLLGSPFVEVFIPLWSILQRDDRGVDCLGDLYLVIEDGHHQLAVIAHDRALAGGERKGLGPAQTQADAKLANLRIFIDSPWITCDVQARNANSTSDTRDVHDIIQHGS